MLRIKDGISGNSATATTLQTARTINGTSFNGSANITTANWGTARTLTIGSTGKSVNGSANVSWTLAEIGAAASSHTHNYAGSSSAGGAATSALTCTGNSATATKLATARTIYGKSFDGSGNIAGKALVYGTYTSAAASRYTSGALEIRENGLVGSGQTNIGYAPQIGFHWSGIIAASLAMSSGGEFQFINQAGTGYSNVRGGTFYGAFSGNASTATTLQTARTINGTSFNGSANITTANWGTARTITIGSTGKSVNGSANVSWSLSEIGAAASSHNHSAMIGINDTRTTTFTPTSVPKEFKVTFQNNNTNGVSDGGNFFSLMHIPRWNDNSGGYGSQLAFTDNENIWFRRGTSDSAWGSWRRVWHSGNFDPNTKASSSHEHNYLTIKGTNTVSSTSNDTPGNWGAQQNSVHFYTTSGCIKNQPTQWGYLVNIGQGAEVHQIWMEQANGSLHHRGGNGNGWHGTSGGSGYWRTLLDSENFTSYAISKSASCNKNWNWSGQSGQPNWLWGGNDGTNMYVYNPSNFSVAWATGAGYGREWRCGTWNSYITTGNGDNATWTTHNVIFKTWWGLGVRDYTDTCRFLIDARTGNTFSKGYFMGTSFQTSSDRRLKEEILPIDEKLEKMFMELKPVNYYMINEEDKRRHNGFIAQEVEEAMANNDISYEEFAGLMKREHGTDINKEDIPIQILNDEIDKTNVEYTLNYSEFTALNTHMIQKCLNIINTQSEKIEKLEAKIQTLESK